MNHKKLKILALEPYYGGSHKAFLDTWIAGSRHDWNLLTLPPTKWKWRMMHSAVTFAESLKSPNQQMTKSPDIIFATDMLDLAKFKGLISAKFANIPTVAYFHENQLTYPTEYTKERDRHFALSNITTALAADQVWFNSAFHRDEFIDAVAKFAKKAPDQKTDFMAKQIKNKAKVVPQGIKEFPVRKKPRKKGPVRVLWAHRWEFDKAPETFFKAVKILKRRRDCDFRISVLGGRINHTGNEIFRKAEKEFSDVIDHWGYVESYNQYCKILQKIDIAVSTSNHEFFGIGIAEAVSAGAFPVVPRRLAYPEILAEDKNDKGKFSFFYEGAHKQLAEHLMNLIKEIKTEGSPWQGDEARGTGKIARFYWGTLIPELDDYFQKVLP